MITDSEKEEIRRTWKLVVPIGATAADLFYKRLFEVRPEYAELFKGDMPSQKRKLIQMLAFIVKSLDWPESAWKDTVSAEEDLVLIVLALGRRHKDLYRIPEESYAVVCDVLIWTLDYGLGQAFDDSARAAWHKVYQLVATTMRMGAAMTNAKSALEQRAHTQSLGEVALDDFQNKFGNSEVTETGTNSRGETA